jgi:hypothetical protein
MHDRLQTWVRRALGMGLRDGAGGVEKRCAGRACAVYGAVSSAEDGVVDVEGVKHAV